MYISNSHRPVKKAPLGRILGNWRHYRSRMRNGLIIIDPQMITELYPYTTVGIAFPVLIPPYFFPRTFSPRTIFPYFFKIRDVWNPTFYNISELFFSTCRYNIVHVPCGISIQTLNFVLLLVENVVWKKISEIIRRIKKKNKINEKKIVLKTSVWVRVSKPDVKCNIIKMFNFVTSSYLFRNFVHFSYIFRYFVPFS
jgi:hypothetical protein